MFNLLLDLLIELIKSRPDTFGFVLLESRALNELLAIIDYQTDQIHQMHLDLYGEEDPLR